MINLLPPQTKENIRYSKLNQYVMRYIRLLVVVIVVLAAAFAGTWYYVHQQVAQATRDTADKQATIAGYNTLQTQANSANSRLTAISAIQAGQTKFSQLLDDLAAVMPKGAVLSSITLTGSDTTPVQVSITA